VNSVQTVNVQIESVEKVWKTEMWGPLNGFNDRQGIITIHCPRLNRFSHFPGAIKFELLLLLNIIRL